MPKPLDPQPRRKMTELRSISKMKKLQYLVKCVLLTAVIFICQNNCFLIYAEEDPENQDKGTIKTQYLAFQIFTGSFGSEFMHLNTPETATKYISDITASMIKEIGINGNNSKKLGFFIGPLSFDDTDEQVIKIMRTSFEIAIEKNIAVGFHVDDSMFWGRLKDLNKIENIEWLDWNKTPNTGRRLDWSSTPTLGGGVVGDLGGFIASTYRRGVNYIQIPTTLLGLVDCGLGGKTAFNFREAKNLIGAFWQPKLVFMDIDVLKTLPVRELKCGLAETIKYGIIKDSNLFAYLENNIKKLLAYDRTSFEHIIPICVKIKAAITSADERDVKDIRIILNYGHTVGHAIESATKYKKYKHGEAIAIGMIIAAGIANKLKLLDNKSVSRIVNLIKDTGLPVKAIGCPQNAILSSMKHDKKFIAGVNRFVLPIKIGKARVVNNVSEKTIKLAIKDICS